MVEKFRPAVLAIIFKKTDEGIRVMTQLRKVQDFSYDPLYDNTWEGMQELLKQGEDVISAIFRGCREEFGLPDFTPIRIIGAEEKVWTSSKGDIFFCHRPLCYLESCVSPQPWIAPAFAVEVAEDFQPQYEVGDKEATECKWWTPAELLKAIEDSPRDFMGFQWPAFHLFCQLISKGQLSI